ncbi:MAG: 50S ribosomal protein L20 [Parcubacteria group bacterium]|nr:50S ribosomal protein L20 [Parcubacteria group bacterium]
MTRVKRGKTQTQKRERLLRRVKGFKWGRKAKERLAKEALLHAGSHAYRGRKEKKREFRRLWQVKINAASRANGITYSQLIAKLKKAHVELDRKILANLAENYPEAFAKIVEEAKKVLS